MNIRKNLKADIALAVDQQTEHATVQLSRPSDPKNGDYSTNIAMQISHKFKQSPMEAAKKITDNMQKLPYIEKLEVKEPGFINLFVKETVWQETVKEVLKEGEKFGSNGLGSGRSARVEFVSANPTGPLHFGNARGGPIGDTLASVLTFCGYEVIREYFHNDIGVQVDKLGESIVNVSQGRALEEQEYKGEYIRDLAAEIGNDGDSYEVGKKAVGLLLAQALKTCKKMGIEFDQIYKESEFLNGGDTKQEIDHLTEKGFIKEKDGALWFAPSDEFLKDRETVVVKSNGSFTYFANDIAYHDEKFKNKSALVIDIFGSNHHGHVPRLQAAISALGYDVSRFHIILYQWVRFKRGGEVVKMSKRAGTFITAEEVLDEIGRDAVRFFILMHDANSPIDFDLDLARDKSSKNPVYYVQYAHARIASILAKSEVGGRKSEANCNLLSTNYEVNLIKQISYLPELVEDISMSLNPHHLTSYAVSLADAFHKFYENCQVIGEEKSLMEARVALLNATKTALANTLALLGVSAPQNM